MLWHTRLYMAANLLKVVQCWYRRFLYTITLQPPADRPYSTQKPNTRPWTDGRTDGRRANERVDGFGQLPLLGTICRVCGHFPVHFKKDEVGKFTLDREKMAEVSPRVDEHLAAGKVLAIFPEGQVSTPPTTNHRSTDSTRPDPHAHTALFSRK